MILLSVMLPNLAMIDKAAANSYKEITVYGYSDPRPGVLWGQKDNGDFETRAGGTLYNAQNVGTKANPVPKASSIPDRIDMRNYPTPGEYTDPLTNKKYPASKVEDKKLDARNGGVSFDSLRDGSWYKGLNIRVDGDYHVAIYTETGQGYQEQRRYQNGGSMPDGSPKWSVEYYTPLKVTWVGKIRVYDTALALEVNSLEACVGETIRVTPVLTKADGSKHNVVSHPNFSYSFPVGSGIVNSVVSGNSIIVTGKSVGTVGFIGRFIDNSQNINTIEDMTFRFKDCSGGGVEPVDPTIPPTNVACSVNINVSDSNSMADSNISANPNGNILEDKSIPSSAVFDVLRYGIPSSEFLNVKGQSEKYLSEYRYRGLTGSVTYNFNISKDYMYTWEVKTPGKVGEDGKVGEETVEIKKEHIRKEQPIADSYNISYWLIDTFKALGFMDADFRNYALPNELVNVPNNQRPTASASHNPSQNAHVFPKSCQGVDLGVENIDGEPPAGGPSEDLTSHAEIGSRAPDVKNDRTQIDNFVSMSDSLASLNAPTPNPIPRAPLVEVQRGALEIAPTKVNKRNTPSSITSKYETIFTVNAANSSLQFTGNSSARINTVTVHTPVVMFAQASDDKEHDQRLEPPERSTPPNPATDKHAFVLDRPFTVTLPKSGQHLNEPGYGDRDFEKYVAYKEVRFPFDVYTETKQGFYPKNQWIKVPNGMETVNFFLPVWVPEGEYELKFRSIAINSPQSIADIQQEERNANLNLEYQTPNGIMEKHIAVSTVKVDVIGRLYDFRVTDILDFRWGPVFRTTEGLIEHTGNHYWVGDKMIDGDLRGNEEPFVLPVRHGSHPKSPTEMKNVAVKTGYQFKFDMKSKGDLWNHDDAVRINPSFHFVNKDGTDRRPVDVYYHDDANYFVKIGSDKDKEYRDVTLNERLRNVEEKQLFDTAEYMYRHPDEYGYREAADKVSKPSFIRKFNRDYSKQKTRTGPYGWQMLNWNLRTLIGPEATDVPTDAMIPPEDAIAREQQWYGEYSLPAEIFVSDKGRDISGYGVEHRLTKNSPVFLQDGYIIVNFDIETIDKGDTNNPKLSYHKGPLDNQWKTEGFKYNFVDPYGNNFDLIDGDVILYHGDQSSYDDFDSNVTH